MLGASALASAPLASSTSSAAGNAYTLQGSPATYNVVGSNATFVRGDGIIGAPGSYAVAGSSATLTKKTPASIQGATGVYKVMGAAGTLTKKTPKNIIGTSPTYALTYPPAALLPGYLMNTSPGLFVTYTAQDAILSVGRDALHSDLAFVTAGSSAMVTYTRVTAFSPGSYQVNGSQASFDRQLYGATPTYTFAASATLVVKYILQGGLGAYQTQGSNATLLAVRDIVGSASAYTISASTATMHVSTTMYAVAGSYQLQLGSIQGNAKRTLLGVGTTYTLAVVAQQVVTHYKINGQYQQIEIAGRPANLTRTRKPQFAVGSYTIGGRAGSLQTARSVTGRGSIAIVGSAATMAVGRALAAQGGRVAISGSAASLVRQRGVAAGSSGAFTMSGAGAVMAVYRVLLARPLLVETLALPGSLTYSNDQHVESDGQEWVVSAGMQSMTRKASTIDGPIISTR